MNDTRANVVMSRFRGPRCGIAVCAGSFDAAGIIGRLCPVLQLGAQGVACFSSWRCVTSS